MQTFPVGLVLATILICEIKLQDYTYQIYLHIYLHLE